MNKPSPFIHFAYESGRDLLYIGRLGVDTRVFYGLWLVGSLGLFVYGLIWGGALGNSGPEVLFWSVGYALAGLVIFLLSRAGNFFRKMFVWRGPGD